MSIEDFGTNPLYGVQLAYHIAEDLFVEAAVARTEAGLSSIEELANVACDRESRFHLLQHFLRLQLPARRDLPWQEDGD